MINIALIKEPYQTHTHSYKSKNRKPPPKVATCCFLGASTLLMVCITPLVPMVSQLVTTALFTRIWLPKRPTSTLCSPKVGTKLLKPQVWGPTPEQQRTSAKIQFKFAISYMCGTKKYQLGRGFSRFPTLYLCFPSTFSDLFLLEQQRLRWWAPRRL